MNVVAALPQFGELPDEARTVEALKAMCENPPILHMHLADLEREERLIRGAYDCSWPDVDPELALTYGRQYTQFLTRYPDWRKSHKPAADIHLVEVTPVTVTEGDKVFHKHAIWKIVVIGEAEQKLAFVEHGANSSAMMRRAAAA